MDLRNPSVGLELTSIFRNHVDGARPFQKKKQPKKKSKHACRPQPYLLKSKYQHLQTAARNHVDGTGRMVWKRPGDQDELRYGLCARELKCGEMPMIKEIDERIERP